MTRWTDELRRRHSRSPSTASEESDVERSLPPSPTDPYFATSWGTQYASTSTSNAGSSNVAGPSLVRDGWNSGLGSMRDGVSRTMQYAMDHAREDVQVSEGRSTPRHGNCDVSVDVPTEDTDDELREITEADGDYANIGNGMRVDGTPIRSEGWFNGLPFLRRRRGTRPSAGSPMPGHGRTHTQPGGSAADREHRGRARAPSVETPRPHANDHQRAGDGSEDEESSEEELEPLDQRQCRICFGGVEDQDTLGRLISPCLCMGSMRYVHVQCINAWRGTGTNARAFMECPQCHHRYTLRRTLISGLAQSRPILLLLSSLLFLLLTLLAGQALHLLLSHSTTASKRILKPKSTTLFDLFQEDWDHFDNGVIIVGGGGGTLVWDVMVGSIQAFASVAARLGDRRASLIKALGISPTMGAAIFELGLRFLLGLAVLGSLSFISLLFSLSLFAPLQLANGLRGAGIFNFANGRRRAAAAGARDGTPAGQIMIIIFVLIGAVNTLVTVYNTTQGLTQKLLMYVETQILEVNPEDRRRVKLEGRRRRRERKAKWWRVWWREGRWARREGWEEVKVRLWMAARDGLGPVWDRMWTGREHGHRDEGGPAREIRAAPIPVGGDILEAELQ